MLPPVAPVVVVEQDGGGIVADFAARVADYRRHHVQVRVTGWCASSCTLVLALKRTCAEDGASFAFHRSFVLNRDDPSDMSTPAPAGTRIMLQHYPRPVRAWIAAHGGLTERLITLSGAEMRAIVPACR